VFWCMEATPSCAVAGTGCAEEKVKMHWSYNKLELTEAALRAVKLYKKTFNQMHEEVT
jgi:hypothetical protein